MKPALQMVKLQQQSGMLLSGSPGLTKVKSVQNDVDITFTDEGYDGEARAKRRNLWDE